MLDLKTLEKEDARLIQAGLKYFDFYEGTTKGQPGPNTEAGYAEYLNSLNPFIQLNGLPDLLVSLAEGEVGTLEEPRNSNKGPRIQEYQDADWLPGTGYAWCASFICWLYQEAQKTINFPWQRPRTAGAWDLERWAVEQGLLVFDPNDGIEDMPPILPGDITIFDFSHVGICSSTTRSADTITTVEGNTNGEGHREGNGVYFRTRERHQIKVAIRPELTIA